MSKQKKPIIRPKGSVSIQPTEDMIAAVIEWGELRGIGVFTRALQDMAAAGYESVTGKTITDPFRTSGGHMIPKGKKLVDDDTQEGER